MNYLWLIPYYVSWHYTYAITGFFRTWGNFIWFLYNYFSIGLLSRTLFQPFERVRDHYRKGMLPGEIFQSLIFNLISRVVGFVLRSFMIFVGLITICVVILLGAIVFVVWIFMPLILGFILINGLRALIQKAV